MVSQNVYLIMQNLKDITKRIVSGINFTWYLEFRLRLDNDWCRNNSLFSAQWLGLISGVAKKMLEEKRKEFNSSQLELLVRKYNWVLKTLPQDLAAIQKFSPQFKVFSKFANLIVENFFKYKEFNDVTRKMVEEVYKPFVASSLKEANISNENIALCGQDSCQSDLTLAQSWLLVPIELLKVR